MVEHSASIVEEKNEWMDRGLPYVIIVDVHEFEISDFHDVSL